MNNLTIVDIARLAGVSVSTVSRVINKHPDVSAASAAKVLAIIEQHGYVPNNSARNLKRDSSKAIGVIIKGFTNHFFISMLKIIQQEIERNGYSLILAQVETDQDEVTTAISLCKEKKPRGLIFMGGNFRHSQDKLQLLDAPYVMLTITTQDVDRDTFSSVTVDDFEAGRSVAEAIHGAGHRNVALMGSQAEDMSISKLRLEGFIQRWAEFGLTLPQEAIAYSGSFSYKAGYDATLELLKKHAFTCLFCVSDVQAIGAMRAIHASGLRIPGDISVVGFDGIEECSYFIPSLATMRQPFEKMANNSVRLLLDTFRSGAAHKHLVYPAKWCGGESFSPVGL